ncbi:hypothetical protein [Desulforamulus ruminis]|uniref:Uncharacterized protein n=1 Tax=Desulforamulus ruminis (strain ATCC 23193 / DSM 2154 / NCIMB 8452 / DL) TaxID=696281 RepID=F6DTM5_DESRL|nr:hypothetical protein [Desulforamulus ruminis]AEG61199.1 hypothetical protein Desru_2986 [Desulforamulus ruminis DSM 2154]
MKNKAAKGTSAKTPQVGANVNGSAGKYMMEEMGAELGVTEQGKASKKNKMKS